MTAEPLSLGFIGCGTVVHRNYAMTLIGRNQYKVNYVHDLDTHQAASAAEVFNARSVSRDELLDAVDAVIITTPPSTHMEIVRACLRQGKIVLCEKPFMTTARDAATVVAEAREAGTLLYVSHFRRMFPQIELAKDLVQLGTIGGITGISASEGGRYTWGAVSGYTTLDKCGGVLWDTGSHTMDSALFVSGLDCHLGLALRDVQVERDRDEPSHDFRATFEVLCGERKICGRLHLSRKEALPNLVRVSGDGGELLFVTGMDNRVRLSTPAGSKVLSADRSHIDMMECFDLQMRRVLLGEGADTFAAERFVALTKILEALANA